MKKISELEQSKYCYIGTNILINKKDIRDYDQLMQIEKTITTYQLSKICLGQAPFNKTFDLYHYLNIHKYLFENIYPFAGNLRDENINKSNEPYKPGKTPFCEVPFILNQLQYTLEEMKYNIKNIKTKDDLITFISKYYLDINIIHPFREGNGRTQREFFREYIELINKLLNFNFIIDYDIDNETKDQFQRALVLDDIEEAKKVFSKMIKEKEILKFEKK